MLIVIGFLFILSGCNEEPEITEHSISLDWACMDGCFDMLGVIYGTVSYDNTTLENYHTECTNICHDTYLNI